MAAKVQSQNLDRRWRAGALCILLGLVAFSIQTPAQVLYGSIVGSVSDASGALVPNASVTITQVETNQTRESVSNASGTYSFVNVPPGTYQVVVKGAGFQTFTAQNVAVEANRSVRVDAKLNVGAVQESVTVSAEAQTLQTETAAVQTQLQGTTLQTVPINGRSFQSALVLAPGVEQPDYFQTGGINNPARAMRVSVNGAPNSNTVFRLDGVSATNQWIQGLQAYTPAFEAIETVDVVTNSFDADQGMAGGASVNVHIKSGTNSLHGSAFEYHTDSALRARNYFLPPGTAKTKDVNNVFGGTIGGPIKRDKLFYFFSLESNLRSTVGGPYTRQQNGSGTQFLALPPTAIRGGNFASSGTVIYDPNTGNANGTGRIPFAFANCPGMTSTSDPGFANCNYIPANRINPVAKNILALLPQPQFPGTTNNYLTAPPYRTDYHKIDTKITWNTTDKITINGRFSYLPASDNAAGLYPIPSGAEANPLSLGTLLDSNVASSSVSATAILTPSLVVDGLFGFTRQHTFQKPPGPEKCWGQELGIPNSCQQPLQRDYALARIDFVGFSALGNGTFPNDNQSSIFDYLDPQYQWVGNATWSKGSHNFKFGMDVHRLHMNHYEITAANFAFTGGVTALSGGAAPNLYNSFADFLLGLPQNRQASLETLLLNQENASNDRSITLRSWEYGLYARDQWQLNRKITLSLGLRWEYYPVPTRADRGIEIFDFNTNTMLLCGISPNPIDCGIKVERSLFTPRVGIAYRPTETLVIRAGMSRNPQNDNMVGNRMRGFPVNVSITDVGANSFQPVGLISNGFPILPVPDVTQPSLLPPAGAGLTTLEENFVRGKITMFNFSVQKMLPQDFSVTVGYVGNRQRDMVRNQNINYGQIGGGTASQPFNKAGLANGFRTTAAVNVVRPLGHVDYDSLQITANRRSRGGLAFQAAYTYANATDAWAGGIPIPEYWDLNEGPESGIPHHKLNISASYDLPVGSGRRFLADGIVGKLIGAWGITSMFQVASGTPFTVTSSAASLNAPGSSQIADKVKDAKILGGIGPTNQWFDVTAFKPVTAARFGNSGYNSMYGPGWNTWDASLTRTFHLPHEADLQFRVEVFNLLNHPNFQNPGSNVSNLQLNQNGSVKNLNGFGAITATNSVGREFAERYFRLGLRVAF